MKKILIIGIWFCFAIYANAQLRTSGTGSGSVVYGTSPTLTTPSFTTGFKIGGAAASGKIPIGDGSNYIASTPTYPNTATLGNYITGDGTNWGSTSGIGQASITSPTAGISNTETIVVKTGALAANRLQVGTVIRITLIGTCTSTVANVSTFAVRIGTAGTTADGLMVSAATPAAATTGTAVPFRVTLEMTITAVGSGTSGTNHAYCTLLNTGVTGICATQTPQIILPTFTGFNTQTANNIISATYKSAASTTTSTFQDAFIEIIYK